MSLILEQHSLQEQFETVIKTEDKLLGKAFLRLRKIKTIEGKTDLIIENCLLTY